MWVLCKTCDGHVRYAPLYIHSFRLAAPRKLVEAQRFRQKYRSYAEIPTVPERLRWCRHHMGLMQKEVADKLGISAECYKALESGGTEYLPKELANKLAALFQIPVEDLLDDYNRFLYYGQGKQIQEHRLLLGLDKKPYARLMKMNPDCLRAWESEKKRISRSAWEKYFKGIINA